MLLNVILHTSKVNLLWRTINLKTNILLNGYHLERRAMFLLRRIPHNWFLAKEFCSCGKKLVFFQQESDIHEILLMRILNLERRPTILSLNRYHLGRRAVSLLRWINHQMVFGKIILFLWEKTSILLTRIRRTRDSSYKNS